MKKKHQEERKHREEMLLHRHVESLVDQMMKWQYAI